MKIRIGIRNNLFYPLNLIIFIFLRRIIEMLISLIYGNTGLYLYPAIIFASKFIFGLIVFSYSRYFIKSIKLRKIMGINLIQAKNEISKADNSLKIFILIFFASYFDFIGSIARKSLDQKEDIIFHSLGQKLRSFQIIISALLCYFTIRTKIYRHNLFSLILIFFCLILIISIEIISIKIFEKNYKKLLYIGKTLISGFGRAFLDTIEKYLFEFDYLSPFKVMAIEGILDIFLLIIYFFIQRDKIDKFYVKNFETYPLLLIFLLILYFIFSGLKNIYRVITIKLYSPMTRALTESITDPIIILTNIIIIIKNSTKKEENNFYKTEYYYCIWLFNTINIFCTIIMAFCSCVYNDFVVLYCCGLEHNTYLEIAERSRNACEIDINTGLMEEEDENSSEENINTELTIN